MVRRPREPCSSKTSSVVSKTQRRFNRFLMLISTSVLNRVSNYDLIRCTLQLVVLRSGSGRTVRYTRDDLRTMLRRVVVPSSLTTSSVPNKAHRRFRRFQAFILHTSILMSVNIHTVCILLRNLRMSRTVVRFSR